MSDYIFISDLVEDNGKTIKENNLEKKHEIKIGALVEIEDTGERLFVCQHIRDCDGTPLYAICMWDDLVRYGVPDEYVPEGESIYDHVQESLLDEAFKDHLTRVYSSWSNGYNANSLKVIR